MDNEPLIYADNKIEELQKSNKNIKRNINYKKLILIYILNI
jgi:hypothetical protein